MATKLGLYNDALLLLGQRRLASLTEDRPNRYDLDEIFEESVNHCLELVRPRYATKTKRLVGVTPTEDTGYSKQIALPSGIVTIAGVYKDGRFEQPVTRYAHEGNLLFLDYDEVYVRYIADYYTVSVGDAGPSFARVVSAYLARELASKINPQAYAELDKELSVRIQVATEVERGKEGSFDSVDTVTLTPTWVKIYNDALLILGLPPIADGSDDSQRKNRLTHALSNGLVESVLEDTKWGFGIDSDAISPDASVAAEWGYQNAFKKPLDMHRLNGVFVDDRMTVPLRNYADEGDYIFADVGVIYIEYVSKNFVSDSDAWPAYFKRLVAARMAVDAGASIDGANMQLAYEQYRSRREEAMSTDSIQSPPRIIREGSWSKSRYNRY